MIKKMGNSGNSGTGQLGLDGKVVGNGMESLNGEEREKVGLSKSALQEYVRRGLGERAAYVAYQLSNKKTGWILWRRLNIIAVEDCLDGLVIVAVSELSRQAMKYGYETWDGRRCAVAAAMLMAESRKDRRADEFLELMDVAEKGIVDEELEAKMDDLAKIEDYVHDQHTANGRRMGRGDLFWYDVSSETVEKTSGYEEWRRWFKPLMVRLAKEE
jgi:hypothetical protein